MIVLRQSKIGLILLLVVIVPCCQGCASFPWSPDFSNKPIAAADLLPVELTSSQKLALKVTDAGHQVGRVLAIATFVIGWIYFEVLRSDSDDFDSR